MIMKRVEEEAKAKIISMKTDYKVQIEKEKEFNALFFTAVFARNAWSSFENIFDFVHIFQSQT